MASSYLRTTTATCARFCMGCHSTVAAAGAPAGGFAPACGHAPLRLGRLLTTATYEGSLAGKFLARILREVLHGSTLCAVVPDRVVGGHCLRRQFHHAYVLDLSPQQLREASR